MSERARIFVLNAPEEINGQTWWRMYRPLRELYLSHYREIEIIHNETGNLYPHHFLYIDLALVFRPSEPAHVQAMTMARDAGVPIIADWDDDILNVPVGHPRWKYFQSRAPYIRQCIELANTMWVSTRALAASFKHANPVVVPNAIYETDMPDAPSDSATMLWRGSEIHREDVDTFKIGYRQLLGKVDRFEWLGYAPTWCAVEGKQVDFTPDWISTDKWLPYLREKGYRAIWKPLMPCPFNDAKSNISWLEATCAGGVVVTNYAGKPGWEHAWRELPKNHDQHRDAWQKSRDAIIKHYHLSDINEIRYRSILETIDAGAA